MYALQVSEGLFWGAIALTAVLLVVVGLWAKAMHQQREQARLQDAVRNLLFEYIPLEGGPGEFEMESVSKGHIVTTSNSSSNSSNSSSNGDYNNNNGSQNGASGRSGNNSPLPRGAASARRI